MNARCARKMRAREAARAAGASPSTPARVATNVAARVSLPTYGVGYVRRSSAVKMTATQRNSENRPSEWNRSPEFFTDPKWSRTVTECE